MKTKKLIYKMLTESTGSSFLDSGSAYGRHWQRNQKKSLKDFENEPSVLWKKDYYIISLFHYLNNGLELDHICDGFNKMKVKDWDSDIYGVSTKGKKYIDSLGMKIGCTFNSYNSDSALSQVIQGTWLNLGDRNYLLLQIHQGCDVRGGYTDAKMFYCPNYEDGALLEDVYGYVTLKNGNTINVSNRYDGYNLTNEENNQEIKPEDILEAKLSLAND